MPLPLIIGIGAAIAGTVGAAGAVAGATEMYDANDKMKRAKRRHDSNIKEAETKQRTTVEVMDSLGKLELKILSSFKDFSDLIEKIQNRPVFKRYDKNGVHIPQYSKDDVAKVSVGAITVASGLVGMAAGAASGIAASGGTTAAVMALGTASTGTAISSLSGAAATNAALAALGGGSLAAGGGGMALGSLILGGATLGVGLLVGGVIMGITGDKLSEKADEAWKQMERAEDKIKAICAYFDELLGVAKEFNDSLNKVRFVYNDRFRMLKTLCNKHEQTYSVIDYNRFSSTEKMLLENTALLVGVLYGMCKVQLLNKPKNEDDLNIINSEAIHVSINEADRFLEDNNLI